MLFPTLETLSTKTVIAINREKSINDAIALMTKHNIRDVIVISLDDFYIFTAKDLIRLKLEGVSYDTALTTVPLSRVPQLPPQTNILEAMDAVRDGVDYICLVENGELCGIVSYTDLAASIDPEILMETQRIGDLFRKEQTVRVQMTTTTHDAFSQMKEQNQSAAIVLDGENAVGILTQKDVIGLLAENSPINLPVSKYMSSPLITIPDSYTIQEALSFSQDKKIKRIVVERNDGKILGICNQRDLVTTAYSKWAKLIKNHQQELKEINEILSRRAEALEKLASTDALTGLYNRHMLSELFARELAQKKRYKNALSMIIFDIDHFKKINDGFGHLAGDEVLKKVARIAQDKVRTSDIVARWGGEEFVVLLPHTPLDGARITAEKIRLAIESTDFDAPKTVTASFGIAECADGENRENLLDRADKALYEAKAGGRNQTVSSYAD